MPFIKLELFLWLALRSASKWHNLSKLMSGKVSLFASPVAPFCSVCFQSKAEVSALFS